MNRTLLREILTEVRQVSEAVSGLERELSAQRAALQGLKGAVEDLAESASLRDDLQEGIDNIMSFTVGVRAKDEGR